jgi:hypothetical protein
VIAEKKQQKVISRFIRYMVMYTSKYEITFCLGESVPRQLP